MFTTTVAVCGLFCLYYVIDADKQTNKQTDTQNDYCNPRCACALRVNNQFSLYFCCGGEQGEGGLKGLGDKIDGLAGGLKGLGEKVVLRVSLEASSLELLDVGSSVY